MSREIIKLTESDLKRILKKIIREQGGLVGALLDPSNVGFDEKHIPQYKIPKSGCLTPNPGKNKMIALFTYCNNVTPDSNTAKINSWNERLYKSMKGLGTSSDFIKVFKEIKTINELSAIWRTFKYDGENLWEWMQGESSYSWDDTYNSINSSVKSPAKITECLKWDPNRKIDML